ncbi:MAG: diguanylate cyclase [Acidimicrobiaceae bacterium]|jgi:diguanylate cyclase (GGDEF)-like protein|nr:diguanylate cyclase [Acidimicrobiaceae bacterium]
MLKPPRPPDESARLATLYSLEVLDLAPQERFDRITRTAQRLFGVPIALVSLIDSDRQWFMSRVGFDTRETSRDVSFCAHALVSDEVMTVEDAASDLRFFDNPLVSDAPGIRFYAGAPIKAPNGARLGTLCVIDVEPRRLAAGEREALLDLAAMVENEIATTTAAVIDELTGLVNRRGLELLGSHALLRAHRSGEAMTALFADVDEMRTINDDFGHDAGDAALRAVADVLWSTVRGADVAARLGGDEFVVLLLDTDALDAEPVVARILDRLANENATAERPFRLRMSIGHATVEAPELRYSLDKLLELAEAAMRAQKLWRKQAPPPPPTEGD